MTGKDAIDITSYISVPRAHNPSWSYDGMHLAYIADIDGLDQVWVTSGTEEPRQVTHLTERVEQVAWSPVDQQMIISIDVGGNEHFQLSLLGLNGELRALTNAPHVIHHFGSWSPDGTHISYSSNQRNPAFFDVWVMGVSSGQTRCVMQSDETLLANAWSPDGSHLIVSRLNTELDFDLFLLPLNGDAPRLLTAHQEEANYESPCFAPDGEKLYILTNYNREFMAPACLDLATTLPANEHAPLRFLTETSWDAEGGLALSADKKLLSWAINNNGYSQLKFYELATGQELPAPQLPPGVIEGIVWAPDTMQVAFSLNGSRHNGNIWRASPDASAAQQLTNIHLRLDTTTLVEPELIHYTSFDGLEIPAYYYRPEATPGETNAGLPVIVFVHGGPESQFRPLYAAPWMPPLQYYLKKGFAVFAPNVRGSLGYGKTFVHLDDVQLRPNSVADLKAGVEWLISDGGADPRRIGIMGRSYGGFMVLAAITSYPDLWAAAVDIVGIANFVTFLENTGPWRRKWREAEYGSLEKDRAVLEQISPIHRVDHIKAPLLIMHGANDSRVPVSEAEQMKSALQARNVPVDYLRFENEGHFMLHHTTQLKAYPAISNWFEQFMRKADA
ncbi:MAG TPA: S9 family peptidase [Ktedonobacteraceae bacterium]|nr:S9 family peptidase [Ktedonobacteraceae bacterium]